MMFFVIVSIIQWCNCNAIRQQYFPLQGKDVVRQGDQWCIAKTLRCLTLSSKLTAALAAWMMWILFGPYNK